MKQGKVINTNTAEYYTYDFEGPALDGVYQLDLTYDQETGHGAYMIRMEPGTILVCPMTNPAWTPLFAHATGLVTDMGGILGHGSIVAREYGIPAVVGTGNITQRVDHGQEIHVDGDAGLVTILPES